MISLQGVSKSYGRTPVVQQLSLEVADGELVVLLGESGCGKTTTLKMVNRLVEPTAGTIVVDGKEIARADPVELRRSIGYVFQGIGLFPHMTVAENVGVVPRLSGWSPARIEARVAIERLLARTADIRISEAHHGPHGARIYRYEPTYSFRSLSDLHVELTPA